MARRQRRDRWASEAAQQRLVRFGPEQSGLKALTREARSTYTQTVRAAKGAAQGQIQEIGLARPQVQHAYDEAGLHQARIAHDVIAPVVSGLGESARSLVASTAIEQAGAQQRLGESKAAALTGLANRRVQARQGEAFAVANAGNDLKSELTKIFQRRQDLAREAGTFESLTLSQLRDAARKLAQQTAMNEADNKQSERNSIRSSGVDPNTGKPIPGGKLDPKAKAKNGRKWATPTAQAAARRDFQTALDYAHQYKAQGEARHDVALTLKRGVDAQPIYGKTPTGGQQKVLNPDGTPKTTEAVPQIKDQLLLSAALDIAYDGHLSRATQKALHENGIKVGPLGAKTYQQWLRENPRRRTVRRAPLAPGSASGRGQMRPT